MGNKLIEYYLSLAALDGIDTDNPHQYDTEVGILVEFVETLVWIDEKPFIITNALVENPETGDVKLVDCQLLKRFIDERGNTHVV